ncbi:hypothetical protein EN933_03685 [Mesorhizobium sp. M7A.F.Ca.US.001.01.1.1]|nr:hypothetical protein EN933_03685 [Mesorhizobium sp. M7A.F.Ca.US.001.01.1.1]
MTNLLREFDEHQAALLSGFEVPGPLTPERLTPGDLAAEVKRFLQGGQPSKRISITRADVLGVQKDLLGLLERAEATAGRSNVASAYAGGIDRDPMEAYRRDRSRYAHPSQPGPLDVGARLKLAKAACDIIRAREPAFEDEAALLRIFGSTSVSYVRYSMEAESLLDCGRMLSDAWLEISCALDEELSLSSWLTAWEEPAELPEEAIAEMLGVEMAALPPPLVDEGLTEEMFERPRLVSSPDAVDREEYNFMRSPPDDALAPAIPLFKLETRRAAGRLANAGRQALSTSRAALLRSWREVMLQLLPCNEGGVLPCLSFVPKVSLSDRAGREIPLRTPFAWPVGENPRVPLLVGGAPGVTWFIPDDARTLEQGGLSDDTVYQTTWTASPGAVAITLRMMADSDSRPVNQAVLDCAGRSEGFPSQFALGTIGNIMEKATFVPDRADGIGALLRADFHRRTAILRRHGIASDGPWLSRFYGAWYRRST